MNTHMNSHSLTHTLSLTRHCTRCRYTSTHKQRFGKDGRGRGLEGRREAEEEADLRILNGQGVILRDLDEDHR